MKIKRLFLLGDFNENTGPAIANRNMLKSLQKEYYVTYSCKNNIFLRILEAVISTIQSNILIICSKSDLNYIAIIIAKIFRKNILYIMHGYATYEAKINNPKFSDKQFNNIKKYDDFIFSNCDRIVCVSKFQMNYMKQIIPKFESKFDYIYNVVDIDNIKNICRETISDKSYKTVMSVGGGVRQKNNLAVVKALKDMDIKLTIIGKKSADGDIIRSYDIVRWIDHLPQDRLFRLMSSTSLYIQNSSFETFGLTIIEALYSGCSILISNNVGCKDLFSTITDDDLIYEINDIEEIKRKVKKILNVSNNKRLIDGFSFAEVTYEGQLKRFKEIFENL